MMCKAIVCFLFPRCSAIGLGVLSLVLFAGVTFAAPPLPPCYRAQVNGQYPPDDSTGIPLDARVYVVVHNDQGCQEWDQTKLSIHTTSKEPKELPGKQSMSIIGTGNSSVRLLVFTPEKQLQAGTKYELRYRSPTEGFGAKKTIFTTAGVPEQKERVPIVSFVFTKAEHTANGGIQCLAQLTLQSDNIEPGDLMFIHGYDSDNKKASDKPIGAISGSQMTNKSVNFAPFRFSGSGCSTKKICLQLRTQTASGKENTLKEHCTTPTRSTTPASTPLPPGGCQSLPSQHAPLAALGFLLLLFFRKRAITSS